MDNPAPVLRSRFAAYLSQDDAPNAATTAWSHGPNLAGFLLQANRHWQECVAGGTIPPAER
jgi:hypothetical protein